MVESGRLRVWSFMPGLLVLGWIMLGLLMFGPAPAHAQDASGARRFATGMASPLFSAPWGSEAAPANETGSADSATLVASSRFVPAVAAGDQARAVDCMTAAIAYEAGYEPLAGREAVAQVILNRLREPRFPKTVCGVVFDGSQRRTGCQFTFTCDGSLARRLRGDVLDAARVTAVSVLDGLTPDRVRGATHYHANYVNPYWASTGQVTARIGAHLFYRMPADAGRLAGGPVITRGESGLAAAALAPALMPTSRSAGRGHGRIAARQPAAAPARLFAPWGLAMTGMSAGANAQEP
ncbi:cell wall hydrolase [Novosphingobium sp.]|uniref:cell wall hydrolase n=1 Tax=Novosphingobium sp. TaxID=1874826 RepID=UPI003BADB9BD